jgi:hypothetical protein
MRPHVVDPWALGLIVIAFGVGVFAIAWHSTSLRLEVEATNIAWIVLVAFGMTYHGDWATTWRMGAGLAAGAAAGMAAYYGAQAVLPVTALWTAAGIGLAASCVAVITHFLPRLFSFAAAAVGFGVGIAVARAFPFRPVTPADDLFTMMLGATLAIALGTFGSMALRAGIVWVGVRRPGEGRLHFLPQTQDISDDAPTIRQPSARAGAGR